MKGMNNAFRNRVCVVTGASSGIGRQTAVDLARRGARVCVAARREERLVGLLEEIGGAVAGHSYKVTDVARKDDARALASHVEATYGRCDVLINNAGISARRAGFRGPDAVPEVERVMATNFFGAVYCTAELLPLLERSAPASVVNVASVAGRFAIPGSPAYTASKFGLVGWSEALHFELKPRGITVSVVEPGLIPTEGFPQDDFVNHPVFRHAVGTQEQVSKAILDAISRRKLERVVPRWYYLLQVPRVLAPAIYRVAEERLITRFTARGKRRAI